MGPSNGNLVGIIGAGRLGQAMARTARRAGREVVIANSRGPESLASVVTALGEGVSAATANEAAAAGIVVIAVPWDRAGTVRSSSTRPTTSPPTISKGERRASSSPTWLPARASSRPRIRSAPTCLARIHTRPAASA